MSDMNIKGRFLRQFPFQEANTEEGRALRKQRTQRSRSGLGESYLPSYRPNTLCAARYYHSEIASSLWTQLSVQNENVRFEQSRISGLMGGRALRKRTESH